MITLVPAQMQDAEALWRMQVKCFAPLLAKYHDAETNPAAEPLEKTQQRLMQPSRIFYWICDGAERVGALSVRGLPDGYRKLGPIFILPEKQRQGIAQQAIRRAEMLHTCRGWVLETILQEAGLCHLYEKMGYRLTGESHIVNDRMVLVNYQKDMLTGSTPCR